MSTNEGCTCHINPPCSWCVDGGGLNECELCGEKIWVETEEEFEMDGAYYHFDCLDKATS